MGAAQQRSAFLARNAARTKPRGLRQRESLAIVRVEGLDFKGCSVGLRKQGHAAIRQRAVDVHEKQFDACSPFLECGRNSGKPGQGSLQSRKVKGEFRVKPK